MDKGHYKCNICNKNKNKNNKIIDDNFYFNEKKNSEIETYHFCHKCGNYIHKKSEYKILDRIKKNNLHYSPIIPKRNLNNS